MINETKSEIFINKAIKIHNFKFDYSKVNYVGSKTPIIIICPKHGEFEQRPTNHLQGQGCPECSGKKKYTNIELIFKLRKIYNNKFRYINVVFNNVRDKLSIICPEHGVFKQRIDLHLEGRGCPRCNKLHNEIDVINEFKVVHNNQYDYSKVNYIGSREKITIICPVHGEFEQMPCAHKVGHGCERCGNRDNEEKFLKDFLIEHGEKYDYSKVDYISTNEPIIIVCPEHGEFQQRPSHHKRGSGCPRCRESKGEKEIAKWLEENNIKYIPQYKFDDCINIRPLPFDFYLPDLNVCIEYQGIQHYKPVEHFGGVDGFKKQQINDKIKMEYCLFNNIPLIKIKYNDLITIKLNKIIN